MTTIFHGLTTAYSGLQAFQRSIETTSHNIVNAETVGYSRQSALLTPNDAHTKPHAFFAEIDAGQVGSGVVVSAIQRARDQLADRAYRYEANRQGDARMQYHGLQQVEAAFNEIEGDSLTSLVHRFYDAWQELALHANNDSARTAVVEEAKGLAHQMARIVDTIRATQRDLDVQVETTVSEINKNLRLVALLNKGIIEATAGGLAPNDLLDQRDVLFDRLAQLGNFQFTPVANGVVNVTLNGAALVDGQHVSELTAQFKAGQANGSRPIAFGPSPTVQLHAQDLVINGVSIVDYPSAVDITSIRGLVDAINAKSLHTGVQADFNSQDELVLRASGDGTQTISVQVSGNGAMVSGFNNGLYQVTNAREIRLADGRSAELRTGELAGLMRVIHQDAPEFLLGLDKLANALITQVNGLHMSGYNLQKQTGVPFFTGTQAKDIAVAANIQADVTLIATGTSPTSPPGDGNRALDIAALRNKPIVGGRSSEDFYNNLLTQVGYRVAQAKQKSANQELILKGVEERRQSVQGVSLDEEFANLIRFQRAYQGAARMVTTFDEMLNLIVNGLGAR